MSRTVTPNRPRWRRRARRRSPCVAGGLRQRQEASLDDGCLGPTATAAASTPASSTTTSTVADSPPVDHGTSDHDHGAGRRR